METSNFIAIIALLISLASAYISYRAFKHSITVHELESTLAFERDKSELLIYVEQSRNLFRAAIRQIEQTKFVIGQQPEQVKIALKCYDNLFTEFLPKLIESERQSSILWDEIYNWRDKSGRSAFAHHTPKFRSLIDNDRMVYDSAIFCNSEIRAQLTKAQDMLRNGLI
jgi:hypothetical protein